MGFNVFGTKYPACLSRVQIELFQAVAARDDRKLGRIITKYDAIIQHEFPQWKAIPKEIVHDQRWQAFYANGIIGVADFYARCGVSRFIDQLRGNDEDNPLVKWQQAAQDIQAALQEGRLDFVIGTATQVIADMASLSGSGVAAMRPQFLGFLGAAYFRQGKRGEALGFTEQALQGCVASGDREGERIYRGNLAQIAGQPAVVYTTADGATTSEVTTLKASARVTVAGPASVPSAAQTLHQQGRAFGGQGDYAKAELCFHHAHALAPTWAYPLYDLAFTHLMQGKWELALNGYRQVDALEPRGFFTTKTAIWSLEKEVSGAIPVGTYRCFLGHEGIADRRERAMAAQAMVASIPQFTPAVKEVVIAMDGAQERIVAIEKAMTMDADAETRGILIINQAMTLHALGQTGRAKMVLKELSESPLATRFNQQMAGECMQVMERDGKGSG